MRAAVVAAALLFAGFAMAADADIRIPEGPGADLVYAKCRTCHDLQYVVDAKGLVPAQWRAVVASMHDYGLTATKEEDETLVRYLAAYLGPNPPPSTPMKANATAKADGRMLYSQNCATCHGPAGQGQPGLYPPLAKNRDLALDGGTFPVMVVLNGIEGPIDVAGARYDSAMPPFQHLSDAETAAIVDHVEHAFGNAVNASPNITADLVARERARSMTPAQVHAHRSSGAGAK